MALSTFSEHLESLYSGFSEDKIQSHSVCVESTARFFFWCTGLVFLVCLLVTFMLNILQCEVFLITKKWVPVLYRVRNVPAGISAVLGTFLGGH